MLPSSFWRKFSPTFKNVRLLWKDLSFWENSLPFVWVYKKVAHSARNIQIKKIFSTKLHLKLKLLQECQRVSNWEQFKLLSSLIWFEIFGQISNLQLQAENSKIYLVSSVFSHWTFALATATATLHLPCKVN